MDPQHRLLLEVAWEALEDAGRPFEEVSGSRTGVFVGAVWNDYLRLQSRDWSKIDSYTAPGNLFAFAANRISYVFDLKGPSVALDMNCASSLATVHYACQSLWAGEATLALAGGVSLMLSPDSTIAMSKTGLLSREGHCRTLDARADGFVRGEGAGLVVLKPLRLIAPNDRVYAVIRGSAVNHNGRNDWIVAPSMPGQESVLRDAYRRASVDPASVSYVELHGTASLKGDAIEAAAIGAAIGTSQGRGAPCALGSVKTNIGNLDAAAGVAGIIKVALSIHREEIPATLHVQQVNPDIHLDALGLSVQRVPGAWPEGALGRVAGVTATSFGGSNVHVVLEAPPQNDIKASAARLEPERAQLLLLSARSREALSDLARAFKEFLLEQDGAAPSLADICYTACARRSHHEHRLALVGSSRHELADSLESFLQGRLAAQGPAGRKGAAEQPRIAFVFAEDEPEWVASSSDLLREEAVFREALEACERALHQHAAPSAAGKVARAASLFALQVALAALWRSLGVVPSAVVGHGAGELAALHVAGALSLEEAARRIASQGGLSRLPDGTVKPDKGTIPIHTTSMDQSGDGSDLDAAHPSRRIEAHALLPPALDSLVSAGYDVFLEMGPRTSFLDALAESLGRHGRQATVLPSLGRGQKERAPLLRSLGELHTLGHAVNLAALHPAGARCVSLPSYPWQRERLWLDWLDIGVVSTPPEQMVNSRAQGSRICHPVLGSHVELSYPASTHVWQIDLDGRSLSRPSDSPDGGESAHLARMLQAAAETLGRGVAALQKVTHHEALHIPGEGGRTIQVVLSPGASGTIAVRVSSRPSGDGPPVPWTLHATGEVCLDAQTTPSGPGVAVAAAGGHRPAVCDALLAADPEKRRTLLEAHLSELARAVLAYPGPTLDAAQSLLDLGMDSMMAIELSTRIQRELSICLPVAKLLEEPTICRLTQRALELLDRQNALAHTAPVLRATSRPDAHGPLALSFAQQNLCFMEPALSDNPAWNLFHGFRLSGTLDQTALQRSLDELIKRHEALRTRLPTVDGRLIQDVAPSLLLDLPVVNLQELPEDEREDELSYLALEESRRVFDLAQGPLVRFTLVRLDDADHVLLLSFHHLILDLWSMGVFLRELGVLYAAFSSGRPCPLAELPIQYSDFIAWEQQWLEGASLAAQSAYWREKLAGCPATLDLPIDRPRPTRGLDHTGSPAPGRSEGSSKYFGLSRKLSESVQELSQREGVTLYVTLLSAFKVLLHRYSGQEDMPVLSFSAHRNHEELAGLIGFFTNALLMRTDLSGDPTFREILARVRRVILDAFAHENLPLERQVGEMLTERGMDRLPIASQSYFLFQPFPWPTLELTGLSVDLLDITHIDNGSARVELEWVLWRHPEGLRGFVIYDKRVFDAATIQRMTDHFQLLLESVVARPEERLSVLAVAAAARGGAGRPVTSTVLQ